MKLSNKPVIQKRELTDKEKLEISHKNYDDLLVNEISLLEFLEDDEDSREPLPKWAKFEIKERLKKLKGEK